MEYRLSLRKRLDKKLGEAVNLFRDWDATNSFDWNTASSSNIRVTGIFTARSGSHTGLV
jgi:hypothetical protein